MNWIERLYELKGKDHYSQNGEGLILEYIFDQIDVGKTSQGYFIDIGGGDGFYLSNTHHLIFRDFEGDILDIEQGDFVTKENILSLIKPSEFDLLSIDIDGNDYWIIEEILSQYSPRVIVAEFNPSFTDSRTIKYNPDHVWQGDDYYGFSFDAGVKLAEATGYKVIFQIANINMIMVRQDLINVSIPEVTYKPSNFFKISNRPDSDWIFI